MKFGRCKRIASILSLFSFLLAASFAATSCDKANTLSEYETTYLDVFDTVTRLTIYAESREQFQERAEAVHTQLVRYHRLYDIYRDYEDCNNLKTVNDHAGEAPVSVDGEILDLLEFGIQVYASSEGRVNIAYGSVLSLWHTARSSAQLPDAEALAKASEHADIEQVILDRDAGTVMLADSEMRLDVGAIAKGYAVEQVSLFMEQQGWSAAISAGGNVRTVGGKGESGAPWRIGIENPLSSENYAAIVEVSDKAVVTSGDYQRYVEIDGVRYAHVIDPITAYPAAYMRSVTVISDSSATADALSTTLFLMSPEEGRQLVKTMPDTEALWITEDGSILYSEGTSAYLAG